MDVFEKSQSVREVEQSFIMGVPDTLQKLCPEYVGQRLDREKEGIIVFRCDPFAGIINAPGC